MRRKYVPTHLLHELHNHVPETTHLRKVKRSACEKEEKLMYREENVHTIQPIQQPILTKSHPKPSKTHSQPLPKSPPRLDPPREIKAVATPRVHGKGDKCFKCLSYGHIAKVCPSKSVLKIQKKETLTSTKEVEEGVFRGIGEEKKYEEKKNEENDLKESLEEVETLIIRPQNPNPLENEEIGGVRNDFTNLLHSKFSVFQELNVDIPIFIHKETPQLQENEHHLALVPSVAPTTQLAKEGHSTMPYVRPSQGWVTLEIPFNPLDLSKLLNSLMSYVDCVLQEYNMRLIIASFIDVFIKPHVYHSMQEESEMKMVRRESSYAYHNACHWIHLVLSLMPCLNYFSCMFKELNRRLLSVRCIDEFVYTKSHDACFDMKKVGKEMHWTCHDRLGNSILHFMLLFHSYFQKWEACMSHDMFESTQAKPHTFDANSLGLNFGFSLFAPHLCCAYSLKLKIRGRILSRKEGVMRSGPCYDRDPATTSAMEQPPRHGSACAGRVWTMQEELVWKGAHLGMWTCLGVDLTCLRWTWDVH